MDIWTHEPKQTGNAIEKINHGEKTNKPVYKNNREN